MTVPLQLRVGEIVKLTTPSSKKLDAVVIRIDADFKCLGLAVNVESVGYVILRWRDDAYHDMTGRRIQVERPVFVKAVLKRMQTADGILQLHETEATLGAVYQMEVGSMEEQEWGHADHPGKKWIRMSAVFYNPDHHPGIMPIELFEIESN